MSNPRPDWRTIRRRVPMHPPQALAVRDATCPRCLSDVVADEPIVAYGAAVVREPDGTHRVELSGVEWICQRCTAQQGGRP